MRYTPPVIISSASAYITIIHAGCDYLFTYPPIYLILGWYKSDKNEGRLYNTDSHGDGVIIW